MFMSLVLSLPILTTKVLLSHKNFKDNKSDKKVCTYCHIEGHEYEQCFERIGYPDWYKGKNNKKGVKMAAQVYTDMNYGMHRDTPFDMT